MTDFSQYPKSITEIKSDKSGNACDWTVRDMLIDTLREIDSGETKPYMAVIIICEGDRMNTDNKNCTWRRQAGVVSYVESLGLLQRGMQLCDPDKK